MKFIKLKNTDSEEVIVNLSNVSHFYQINESETTICFTAYEDFIRVNISIEVFHDLLNAIDDSVNVWCYENNV